MDSDSAPSPLDSYIDGFNSYSAYFVPNALDPSGEDYLDCVTDCVAANDPMEVITNAVAGRLALLIAGGGVPKSTMAWYAKNVMGDADLARRIRMSARAWPIGWRPGKIIGEWITNNRALAAKASRFSGIILAIYGPVLLVVEADCAFHCIGRCKYTGGNTMDVQHSIDFYVENFVNW
jgi:hypothetical protein